MTQYVLEYDGWFFTEFDDYTTPLCLRDVTDKRVAQFRYAADAKLHTERFHSLRQFRVIPITVD